MNNETEIFLITLAIFMAIIGNLIYLFKKWNEMNEGHFKLPILVGSITPLIFLFGKENIIYSLLGLLVWLFVVTNIKKMLDKSRIKEMINNKKCLCGCEFSKGCYVDLKKFDNNNYIFDFVCRKCDLSYYEKISKNAINEPNLGKDIV